MKNHQGPMIACFVALLLCQACTSAPNGASSMLAAEAAQGAAASDQGVGDGDIVRVLSEVRGKHGVPAMAAAILNSAGTQRVGALGTRKWGTDIPVTLGDSWHLGSDTKIMTATLAAILVEKGKLRWTTTVSEVFPDMADAFHPEFRNMNLLQLLSHVAGLPANLDYATIADSLSIREQRVEAVRKGLRDKPLSMPGTRYLYSNLGYIIAGAIIERVCDSDWETAITEQIFTPLGMTSAGFGGLGTEGTIDQPWGHETAGKPITLYGPQADNPPVLGPAGRVHCTIQDWALFVQDQLRGARGEPGLLKPETYRMLQEAHFAGDYALGWIVADRGWAGGKALTHTGSNTYYLAVAWVAPKKDFAILVCTNEGLDSFEAADEAVAAMIRIASRK